MRLWPSEASPASHQDDSTQNYRGMALQDACHQGSPCYGEDPLKKAQDYLDKKTDDDFGSKVAEL